jgi:hypothetical protein
MRFLLIIWVIARASHISAVEAVDISLVLFVGEDDQVIFPINFTIGSGIVAPVNEVWGAKGFDSTPVFLTSEANEVNAIETIHRGA